MDESEESRKVSRLVSAWFAEDSEGIIYDATSESPEAVWTAILQILKHDLTEDQTACLAAGPLEDLLAKHGDAYDRLEEESKTNVRFNHLLGGVWRREIPHEIWHRIAKARKEVW